jgi:diacylglycerol kinase family enzyme
MANTWPVPTVRLAATVALVLAVVSVAVAVDTAIVNFPRGLIVLALVLVALVTACQGALRRGAPRAVGLAVAALALAIAVALLAGRDPVRTIIAVAAAVAALGAARAAFRTHVKLPPAAAPERPVLIFNPRSGGGKATRFALAQEARRRGIEPIELSPGKDLGKLVADALANGADAIAMAGGDGSQALVAAAAARAGIPYACIPAGTRNHFALDLGVDRDDVVGALDAFVDGGERRVDLAEVNGRVFVNNVSLGLYADAVQHSGYRDAKLRTLLDTIPEVAGSHAQSPPLRWREHGGRTHQGGLALLVSNNPYRLGRLVGSGTRPRLDTGRLGVAVMWPNRGVRAPLLKLWSMPTVEVDGDGKVPAGIDGEAAMLDPPVRFAMRPAALRVRIAAEHPGGSPSAAFPAGGVAFLGALIAIALTGSARSRSH